MQHPDEGTIHSWLDGALSADEAARVEAHMKDCPQCAAAVAEARGFIAAASRILTALDNAPRGVIPIATPKKRVDPIVWRIAATLLVVAGGTFVVFRNGGREAPIIVTDGSSKSSAVTAVEPRAPGMSMGVAPSAADSGGATRTPVKTARPLSLPANPAQVVARGNAPENGFSGKGAVKMGAAAMSTTTTTPPTAPAPPVAYSAPPPSAANAYAARAAAPPPKANVPVALNGNVSVRSGSAAGVAAPPAKLLSPAVVGSVAALDAATGAASLKNVGTRKQIGERITLYEVEPGDTVTLTEIMSLQLEAVVVTGMSTARTADQSTEKSVATQAAKGTVAPAVSASDSQGAAAGVPSPAPAQAARAQTGNVLTSKTGNVQVSNGVTTISWMDPVTRNVMRLSGRMSPVRLEQVRTQIERERAAEAAKKKP